MSLKHRRRARDTPQVSPEQQPDVMASQLNRRRRDNVEIGNDDGDDDDDNDDDKSHNRKGDDDRRCADSALRSLQ
jgi:hypothetical protein